MCIGIMIGIAMTFKLCYYARFVASVGGETPKESRDVTLKRPAAVSPV
jgi:hypothetical protein